MHTRTAALIGEEALCRLAASHVLVAGAGGVGGYIIEALARAGVGAVTVIDGDVFEQSNLNRQLYATIDSIGNPKAEEAARRIALIAPDCRAEGKRVFINAQNAESLLGGGIDYVCDAIDDVSAKAALALACRDRGIPEIACMGAGNRIGLSGFEIRDIFSTCGDPLARAFRKRLRAAGISSLDVCVSLEPPYVVSKPPASISYVPAMAGLTMAGHVINALALVNA